MCITHTHTHAHTHTHTHTHTHFLWFIWWLFARSSKKGKAELLRGTFRSTIPATGELKREEGDRGREREREGERKREGEGEGE